MNKNRYKELSKTEHKEEEEEEDTIISTEIEPVQKKLSKKWNKRLCCRKYRYQRCGWVHVEDEK